MSRTRPSRSPAGDHLIEPVQQFVQGQRCDEMAVRAVGLFGDETASPVLGVNGPLGVSPDEPLFPEHLIKRQCYRCFPYPTWS